MRIKFARVKLLEKSREKCDFVFVGKLICDELKRFALGDWLVAWRVEDCDHV
jgi:hypothetical protein